MPFPHVWGGGSTAVTGWYNHHHHLPPSFSSSPVRNPPRISGHAPFLPLHSPWRPPICFLSLGSCLFWVFGTNGIIGNVGFVSLSMMCAAGWHAAGFHVLWPITPHCVDGPHVFIHSSADGHLDGSQLLANVNNATNKHPWTSFCVARSLPSKVLTSP